MVEKQNGRRDFLKNLGKGASTLAGLSLAGYIGTKTFNVIDEISERGETLENTKYKTGELEGKSMNDLYARYIGVENQTILGKELETNFSENLEKMWDIKIARGATPVAKKFYEDLVINGYSKNKKPSRMNIKEYMKETSDSIKEIKKNLDWKKVSEIENLNEDQLRLVEEISKKINEKDLLSYCLTELMPGQNAGNFNKKVLNFLLENAGREYVELIPAQYDKYTSFGPYQFTQYAIYNVPNTNDSIRGASKINLALPSENKIPDSVGYLKKNDHHKGAFMFAISNLASLVRNLNEKQTETLKDNYKENMGSIMQFVATSHHLPQNARNSAYRWLDNNVQSEYSVSCDTDILAYAQKSKHNRNALYD